MSRNSEVPAALSAARLRAALQLPDGKTPFPWQEALLARFLAGKLPRALDIPTGLGKTAVMAIWLVARAAGAPVPRRLVYVVDRRAVVDQSTAVAEHLREVVARDPSFHQALGLDGALPISTLRGQFVDNRTWLEDPSSPAIVLGTVDMIGSRLLFSGYGVSRKMRPYHAGLLGADSLIVLDEAHLVPPFERLIEQIAKGVDVNERSLRPDPALDGVVPRLQLLSLSATGRSDHKDVFGLTGADRKHRVVKQRLGAIKQLSVAAAVADKELPDALADAAWKLSGDGAAATRIIVFCTSRDHAQKVRDLLEKRGGEAVDVELFVGGRRVYEREGAAAWLAKRGFFAGSAHAPAQATFVIATAAGEVGVDLDADHAVCDVVAWERMVQRLGRVNRRGECRAQVVIVPTLADDKTTPELAERRDATLALIGHLRPSGDSRVARDASPDGLLDLRARAAGDAALRAVTERATTPALLHPPLTRALLEAWSMTSLEDHTGCPGVAPWIRGWPDEPEDPQTTVVWRRYLPITGGRRLFAPAELEEFRDVADPHLAERLETETWRVIEWLFARRAALPSAGSDEPSAQDAPLHDRDVIAVMFEPRDGRDRTLSAGDITRDRRESLARALAGATLVVDLRLGGLQAGLLAATVDAFAVDVTEVGPDEVDPSRAAPRVVPFRLRHIEAGQDPIAPADWRNEASFPLLTSVDRVVPLLVVESQLSQLAGSEDGRSAAGRDQELVEHQAWTRSAAERLAERLGLADHAGVLALAAVLHDEGKRADCWQRAFGAPRGVAYAKTVHRPRLNLLNHYRHELGSLPYAEADRDVQALPPELRELCLHLIAAHHGFARPLLRTDGAPEPSSRLRERAQQIALRFTTLERRWGPWGLAWWETLLRAADQAASRRNDAKGAKRG